MKVTREPLRVKVRGRFGCRRVLVDECCHVFRVEDLYHQIIRERRTNPPGTRGYVDAVVKCGPEWRLAFVWTRNRIWTLGRPFYVCPRCNCRATRLYVPSVQLRPECRRCWGLTYASRARTNYKRRAFGFMMRVMGMSASEWARMDTAERRQNSRAVARARYAARREFL
jgi:hypothetical protein